MNNSEFETFDFLINDEDEVMLLLYQREGEPEHAQIELDRDNRIAVLYRNQSDSIALRDVSDEVFDSLQDADNLLVCELSKESDEDETKIVYAYEAEIND